MEGPARLGANFERGIGQHFRIKALASLRTSFELSFAGWDMMRDLVEWPAMRLGAFLFLFFFL